jgi:REP element-mobilizing transposase RayT
MAYKLRDESPGFYHVVSRGNNKRPIFVDDHDRLVFLIRLNRVATKYGWEIFAYCLMDNHYHLVMRIGERGMSQGMCELNFGYALAFNARHGRINHLFGRRYWSDGLRTDARLLNACRYTLLNPVRAGISNRPGRYMWSSYRATIGLALSNVRLAADELLQLFGRHRSVSIASFVRFCDESDETGHVRWQPP